MRPSWSCSVGIWWWIAATLDIPLKSRGGKNYPNNRIWKCVSPGDPEENSLRGLPVEKKSVVDWHGLSYWKHWLTTARWTLAPASRRITNLSSIPGTEGGWGEIWMTSFSAREMCVLLCVSAGARSNTNALDPSRGSRERGFNLLLIGFRTRGASGMVKLVSSLLLLCSDYNYISILGYLTFFFERFSFIVCC